MMTISLPVGRARLNLHLRSIRWLLPLVFLASALAPAAYAMKPVTWIVLDAGTGRVLSQHDPNSLNYPASLTKMMTLYLTFNALAHHQISLDTRFTVSRHAASMEPTKLGLVPGQTIAVRNLILSIVTQSANDSAVVLAEGLAGSEDQFAARMNAEARILGMSSTNFRNASGLPNRYNYSTAHDLVKLALALYRDFPQYYHFFSTEEFTYDGRIYRNHNHLMAHYPGMDGLKTGFIDASGFNLAASAVRDHHRLIGVIMGGRSWHGRDMEMAALLNQAFTRDGVPASMIAANTPAIITHSPLFRRDVAMIAPAYHAKVELAELRDVPAVTPHPVHAFAALPRHALALRHAGHPVWLARRHLDRHHRHHRRLAARRRHPRRIKIAWRHAHTRLAARRHHRRVHERRIAAARIRLEHKRLHARRLAEARHRHHGHRYAERHHGHHHLVRRRYARLTRHVRHHPHHRMIAWARHHVRHHRVLKRYAALHREHPRRRIRRTVNWTCSLWAIRHHRCPGGHLKRPHGMVKSAQNGNGVAGSSS
ncbi:MAG: D-alanyl-D-alanine carboxypeptidase family protein [Stellaceae bacterium]